MIDTFEIGPTPAGEPCAQVGTENYHEVARAECSRFRDLIREKLGKEPDGCKLLIKEFPHDLGSYYEVVVSYETENERAVDYAMMVEAEAPVRWEDHE